MSHHQGKLDGLCGPYAIVNAFEHCGVKDAPDIFEKACNGVAIRRWPKILWKGTTFNDLKKMIKKCLLKCPEAKKVRVTYPFDKEAPKNNKEYWKEFDQMFLEHPDARCMILGLTSPSLHWIVAFKENGTRINFIDSGDPYKPIIRKNRSKLYAGDRNNNSTTWIITRKELILFEVK